MSAPSFPLHHADFYRSDPFPAFQVLRERSPVHWHADGPFWALTRWADVRWVSTRPDLFSNARGVMIPDPGAIGPEDLPLMLFTDPPRHTQLRKLIKGHFGPRRIRAMEPRIRQIAREVVAGIDVEAVLDFAERVAAPLPTVVIAEFLGIESRDWADFRAWSDAIIGILDPDTPGDRTEAQAALHAYFLAVIEDRRRHPRPDDFVSDLLAAEIEGRALTTEEIYCFCWLLLTAGNETTRNLISQGTLALLQHPGQLGRRLEEPGLIPRAVEEMLRFCVPSMYMARTTTRDVELRGRKIRAGQQVVMLYGSANRDREVFGPTADQFDVTRDPNPHLSFGFGQHICMGAGLARLEARVLFEELLPRLAHAELAGEVRRMRAAMVPGITRMPVRFAA